MTRQLNDDQSLLRDTVARFVRHEYGFERRQSILHSPDGFDQGLWRQMADLGLLGATLPEEVGGFGGGAIEAVIIMEQLGRGLVLEPWLSTAIIGAGMLSRHGSAAQRQNALPAIIAGERRYALACSEADSRFNGHRVSMTAQATAGGHRLNGAKCAVWDGSVADTLLVSARHHGEANDPAGITVLLVDTDSPGVRRRDFRTYDGMRASEISFDDVVVGPDCVVGEVGAGGDILELALDHAAVAQCADMNGAMQALFEMLIEHLKTRKQFGQPLGDFQVLQHRAANMYMQLENSQALTWRAAERLGASAPERRQAVSAAKVQANDAAALIGAEGLQMHGAIGITDEYAGSHYFRRLEAAESRYGDSEYHLGRFIADWR